MLILRGIFLSKVRILQSKHVESDPVKEEHGGTSIGAQALIVRETWNIKNLKGIFILIYSFSFDDVNSVTGCSEKQV